MEYVLFFAAACGAPFMAAIALPGALLYALTRRGRPLLDPFNDNACASCGYDLRGLRGDGCPECGRPIRRTIEIPCPGAGESPAAASQKGAARGHSQASQATPSVTDTGPPVETRL